MIRWLALHVLPTVIHTTTGVITGAVVGGVLVQPFRRVWRKLWRAVDSVDPETDTGIIKQLRELNDDA